MDPSTPNDSSFREIRERVIAANRDGTPLRLRGSGTKDFYGESLEGEILDLRGHSGIVEYEPSELVITARCGTPIAEIEKALAASGQFLAFEPPSSSADSIADFNSTPGANRGTRFAAISIARPL